MLKIVIAILLIIIIVESIMVNNYMNYYKYPSSKQIDLKDIKFKTGDIIFFKNLASNHTRYSGTKYNHVGIIVVMDNEPYLLDLQPVGLCLVPILDHFSVNNGDVLYYKPLLYDLTKDQKNQLKQIITDDINNIKFAENDKLAIIYGYMYKNFNDFDEMLCSHYIIKILNQLNVDTSKPILDTIQHLVDLDCYDQEYLITNLNDSIKNNNFIEKNID